MKLCTFGDYEYVNICSFAVLGIKLWLEEEGDLNRNIHSNSFSRKLRIDTKCYYLSTITLYSTQQTGKFLHICNSNNKNFISQYLKVVGPLGGKFDFFSPSVFEIQSDFDYRTLKLSSTLSEL